IKFQKERERFLSRLKEVSFLRVIPSAANYFLCEVIDYYTTEELCSFLLERSNILIKNCATKAGFKGMQYVRIAIRNQEENDRLVEALLQLNK
ncbi:aminotransferase class I/II-fold pyridoxal phosphate-dependent enzyme, partial [Phocaeicola sartorii]